MQKTWDKYWDKIETLNVEKIIRNDPIITC